MKGILAMVTIPMLFSLSFLFSCATITFVHPDLNEGIRFNSNVMEWQHHYRKLDDSKRVFLSQEDLFKKEVVSDRFDGPETSFSKSNNPNERYNKMKPQSEFKFFSGKLFLLFDIGENEIKAHEYCGAKKIIIKRDLPLWNTIAILTLFSNLIIYSEIEGSISCFE